ncbi:putative deoxyribonuclease RhsB [Planctomycetes bacterium Pan216]|uniref:Putative deoxyribonuclease RhsB n=1 Tax=Kolteria novifilia TaxID=2527975 RepID=A0A518B0J6_9BACT|nr:putative deoxyribonuclease RhsB [Planctomycetes bacterium Pan216]
MFPAAKHYDPVIGIDIHLILTPVGAVVPIPHPFVGFLFDPFDYVPIIGSTIYVNFLHRAIAGTMGKCVPPHIPIGGTFVKPPANECEMFMGSMTVQFDGDAMSYMALPALSCHDVGMIPPPRMNPKKKSRVKSMVLPTSFVFPVPAGKPVLIGGPPIISLMNLIMGLALKALGKGLKRLMRTKLMKKVRKRLKKKLKKKAPSHNKGCGRPGEPVDVVTGANVDEFIDFEAPGPIPFLWRRFYNSSLQERRGALGWGFRHEYERELFQTTDGFLYVNEEGEEIELPPVPAGQESVAQDGLLLTPQPGGRWILAETGKPTMIFQLLQGAWPARLIELNDSSRSTHFEYDGRGRLSDLRTSSGHRVTFEHDENDLLRAVKIPSRSSGKETTIARYDYDEAECLARWIDPTEREARYEYADRRLMTRKTDRNGYSFHYRYDEEGRCVHTWGDDGLYDVRLEYHPECRTTVATFADGAESTYVFNEDGVITEVLQPDGGVSSFIVNEEGDVASEIDPNGDETEYLYDAWGGHTGRIDPTGLELPPMHIMPMPPDPLAVDLPRTVAEWEYGVLLDPETIEGPKETDRLLRRVDNAAALVSLRGSEVRPPSRRDALGRIVRRGDQSRGEETWRYDGNGNTVAYRDADGAVHRREYGSWNLCKSKVSPLGARTRFEHSLRESITRVEDPGGSVSEFDYDHLDRLAVVRRHGQVRERYTYDDGGNLLEKHDGEGNLILKLDPGPGGVLTKRELASGECQSFTHDEFGRITSAGNGDFDVELTYDLQGRVISDIRGGLGVTHQNVLNQHAETTVLDRFRTLYRPEGIGAMTLVDPAGHHHTYEYSEGGLIFRKLASGTTELAQYDHQGRCLVKIVGDAEHEARHVRRYYYTTAGDLHRVEDSLAGTTTYRHHGDHRLESEELPDGTIREFLYDPAGNLLRQPGLHAVTLQEGNRLQSANEEAFTYNDRNHLASRVGADGRKLRYEYNSLDLLVGVVVEEADGDSWEWKASYDPLGRRISKEWRGHRVDFFWDDERLAAELHDGQRLRIYLYANGQALTPVQFVDYAAPDADPNSGESYAIFTNQLGAPLWVEDLSGRVAWEARLDPYGTAHVAPKSTIALPLRFPGHYHDEEIGLFYNRFRYYDPGLGRYLQSDPLGIAGGINLYAYTDNPLVDVDLQGLHKGQAAKGKGKGKSGMNNELTQMNVNAPWRVRVRDLVGMTDEAFAAMRKIAKKHKVKIRMRPSNPECLKWIKAGHPKKPVFLKNKSINDLDVLMGPPPNPGSQGLVGHFKPPGKNAARENAERQLGRSLTPEEAAKLESRRAQRLKEFNRNNNELVHAKGDKVTVDPDRGVLLDNRDMVNGNPNPNKGKEFTGDHDMFDIHKQDKNGNWKQVTPDSDPDLHKKVVDDFQGDPHVQGQHGDHRSWDYDPSDSQASDIDNAILNSHKQGGEPLVDFNPDGGVGHSYWE